MIGELAVEVDQEATRWQGFETAGLDLVTVDHLVDRQVVEPLEPGDTQLAQRHGQAAAGGAAHHRVNHRFRAAAPGRGAPRFDDFDRDST